MLRDSHFMGRDGFYWFHGVVEDRQDPDMLGRVKVRVLGSHTKDKSYIKSEELHWAYIVQPITSAAMNGIGTTPVGPVPGTWVFGFFRDGSDMQEPCVLGTIGGIPQSAPNSAEGFNDPRDQETDEKLADAPRHIKSRSYPKDGSGAQLTNGTEGPQYPQTDFLNEPDTNRIARNEKIEETVLQIMRDMLDSAVPIAFGGSWDEPDIWYNGKYPWVHVTETESGHVKVVDDTPDAEGQLDFDRTGSFKTIKTDGSEVHKIVGDGYTIILRGNHIHVMNNHDERVDKEYNLSIGGRWNVEAAGNINIKGGGGLYLKVSGDANIKAGGNVNVAGGGDANVKCGGSARLTAGGDVNVKAGGAIKFSSSSKVSILAGGAVHIVAGGSFAVDATAIHLNSGAAVAPPATSASEPTEPKQ